MPQGNRELIEELTRTCRAMALERPSGTSAAGLADLARAVALLEVADAVRAHGLAVLKLADAMGDG